MDLSIRTLNEADLPRLVSMDAAVTGRRRDAWYREALQRAGGGSVALGLGAEQDGILVGAMLAAVRYGAFGAPEPIAEVDTIVVHPAFKGKGVGKALWQALADNARALRVERVRTQVDWAESDLLGFLARAGFEPVPRLVLEHRLDD